MEKEFRKITLTFGIIMAVLGALVIWRGVTMGLSATFTVAVSVKVSSMVMYCPASR